MKKDSAYIESVGKLVNALAEIELGNIKEKGMANYIQEQGLQVSEEGDEGMRKCIQDDYYNRNFSTIQDYVTKKIGKEKFTPEVASHLQSLLYSKLCIAKNSGNQNTNEVLMTNFETVANLAELYPDDFEARLQQASQKFQQLALEKINSDNPEEVRHHAVFKGAEKNMVRPENQLGAQLAKEHGLAYETRKQAENINPVTTKGTEVRNRLSQKREREPSPPPVMKGAVKAQEERKKPTKLMDNIRGLFKK